MKKIILQISKWMFLIFLIREFFWSSYKTLTIWSGGILTGWLGLYLISYHHDRHFEDIMDAFPPENYRQIPKGWNGIYRYILGAHEKVPKIIVSAISAHIAGMIVHFLFIILAPYTEWWKIAIYEYIGYIAASGCIWEVYKAIGMVQCFRYKFKRLNRENKKYLWKRLWSTSWADDEPYVVCKGKGRIISIKKEGKKYYGAVQMIKQNIVYDEVLLQEKKEYEINTTGKIYEICGVKFMN